MKKNIEGTPSLTKAEKSSLAVMGGTRITFFGPRAALSTAPVVATTLSLFTTARPPSFSATSGAGVDRLVRRGAMAAAALEGDLQAVGIRGDGPRVVGHRAVGRRRGMQREGEVRLAESREETIGQHGLGTVHQFLGRLRDEHER